MTIHVYGVLEIVEDKRILLHSLNDLVNKYESSDSPYDLSEVEESFIEGMSKGIVAFKINITKIEAKAKLSQNHSTERQERVIKNLEEKADENSLQIAVLMKKNLLKQEDNRS